MFSKDTDNLAKRKHPAPNKVQYIQLLRASVERNIKMLSFAFDTVWYVI